MQKTIPAAAYKVFTAVFLDKFCLNIVKYHLHELHKAFSTLHQLSLRYYCHLWFKYLLQARLVSAQSLLSQ